MIYHEYWLIVFAVSWLILSEIFPASVRGRAISLATVLNWGTNLIVSLTFLDIIGTYLVNKLQKLTVICIQITGTVNIPI